MKSTRVEILIDELVLHGFSPADRDVIGDALQRELGRLVTGSQLGEQASTRSIDTVRTPRPVISAQARPAVVGAQAARAVFGGLNNMSQEQKK